MAVNRYFKEFHPDFPAIEPEDLCYGAILIQKGRYGQNFGPGKTRMEELMSEIETVCRDLELDESRCTPERYEELKDIVRYYRECIRAPQPKGYGVTEPLSALYRFKEVEDKYGIDEESIIPYLYLKGELWKVTAVTGYSQGDYCEVYYNTAIHTEASARSLGELYLGCYTEYVYEEADEEGGLINQCGGIVITDSERWELEHEEKLLETLCGWAGITPEGVSLKKFKGYASIPEWEDAI